jgi:predicted alpha-1,6-mannanase (GH76 family)
MAQIHNTVYPINIMNKQGRQWLPYYWYNATFIKCLIDEDITYPLNCFNDIIVPIVLYNSNIRKLKVIL